MAQKQKIYIPNYISSVNYDPARVLPRLFFYNGTKPSETWYITNASNVAQPQSVFPYVDNYLGSTTNQDSLSLLFNNEVAPYGEIPSASLYTEYWESYVNLLYNPRTRVLNAKAIIPLAAYADMNLNDTVQFRGNMYHLRAINDYSLTTGECNIQLLGPLENVLAPAPVYSFCLGYDVSNCNTACSDYSNCTTTTSTTSTSTTTSTTSTTSTSTTSTTTIPPSGSLNINYLVVAGGGAGGEDNGGGGGAGGLVSGSILAPFGVYNINVGSGGLAIPRQNGQNSTILSSYLNVSAIGGGVGAGNTFTASYGGSGGGGGILAKTAGLGDTLQGYKGGDGIDESGGGGGGAFQAGQIGIRLGEQLGIGGAGGSGSVWLDGVRYAGGGGGQSYIFSGSLAGGLGGPGGGGNGGSHGNDPTASAGQPNTGGGGGSAFTGKNGGSGIVKIQYAGTGSAGTGGTISYIGGYTYHTFTSSGSFVLTGR
jgi:hypothetical protein